MRTMIQKSIVDAFKAIPEDLISYVARIGVGTTFFRAGMLKLDGWADGNTLTLFREEYRLPLIPPEIAAYMATTAEPTLPILLFAGLLTRFAAAALLLMTLVIEDTCARSSSRQPTSSSCVRRPGSGSASEHG